MKKIVFSLLAVVMTVFSSASFSYAQMGMMWHGSNGWGMNGAYCGMYSSGKNVTLSGEVVNVEKFIPMKGMSHGVRLTLKTEKETISVHLGPLWYIEKQDFKIEPKDRITVKGALVNFDGGKAVMASEIQKGDNTLNLWNDRGNPSWSGCCGWDR